jgi:hypothetical protein
MKSILLVGTVSLLVLIAPTSTSKAAPPSGETCGQVTTALGETETSIQSCMNELLDEQLKMIDGLEDVGEEMRAISQTLLNARGTSPFQRSVLFNFMANGQGNGDNLQLMRDQVQRAMLENAAVEDADHDDAFARADQQKGKNCKFSDMPFVESLDGDYPAGLKPFSGSMFDAKFGDGKCNVFKARVDNPGESNDDEVVHVNERSDNMCERVCADRESDSSLAGFAVSPPKRKDERKVRTVFALTDNLAAARRANQDMETASARISALRVQLSSEVHRASKVYRTSSEVYRFNNEEEADSCDPLDVARGLDEAAEVVGLVKNAVAIVTASLELAKETARPPSKQDAAGFNASTAETPFSVAAGISKIVEQSFGFVEQGLKVSALIAAHIQEFAQAQCLEQVQTGVADLKELGNETNDAIAALETKVDDLNARMVEVLIMLNTPQGRREGFPTK